MDVDPSAGTKLRAPTSLAEQEQERVKAEPGEPEAMELDAAPPSRSSVTADPSWLCAARASNQERQPRAAARHATRPL